MPLFIGGGDNGAGTPMIAFGDHQPPRDRADAAFHQTRVLIKDMTVDPGVAQLRLCPGQADDIIGSKQLSHAGTSACLVTSGRSPALYSPRCDMLAGLRRRKPRRVQGGPCGIGNR